MARAVPDANTTVAGESAATAFVTDRASLRRIAAISSAAARASIVLDEACSHKRSTPKGRLAAKRHRSPSPTVNWIDPPPTSITAMGASEGGRSLVAPRYERR